MSLTLGAAAWMLGAAASMWLSPRVSVLVKLRVAGLAGDYGVMGRKQPPHACWDKERGSLEFKKSAVVHRAMPECRLSGAVAGQGFSLEQREGCVALQALCERLYAPRAE